MNGWVKSLVMKTLVQSFAKRLIYHKNLNGDVFSVANPQTFHQYMIPQKYHVNVLWPF